MKSKEVSKINLINEFLFDYNSCCSTGSTSVISSLFNNTDFPIFLVKWDPTGFALGSVVPQNINEAELNRSNLTE